MNRSAQRLPGEIRLLSARRAARCRSARLIDPGAAGIAIDAGRGKIADPLRRGGADLLAIGGQHRVADFAWRHGGEDMGCIGDGRMKPVCTVEIHRSRLARRVDRPAHQGKPACQSAGAVAEAKDKEMRHTPFLVLASSSRNGNSRSACRGVETPRASSIDQSAGRTISANGRNSASAIRAHARGASLHLVLSYYGRFERRACVEMASIWRGAVNAWGEH